MTETTQEQLALKEAIIAFQDNYPAEAEMISGAQIHATCRAYCDIITKELAEQLSAANLEVISLQTKYEGLFSARERIATLQAQLDAMTAEVTETDAMKVAKELAAHPDAPGYFPRAVQAALTVFLANRKARTMQTPDTQER